MVNLLSVSQVAITCEQINPSPTSPRMTWKPSLPPALSVTANKQSQLVVLHDDVVARRDCFQIHSAKSVALEGGSRVCGKKKKSWRGAKRNGVVVVQRRQGGGSLPPSKLAELEREGEARARIPFSRECRSRISIGVPSRCFGWYEMPPFLQRENRFWDLSHMTSMSAFFPWPTLEHPCHIYPIV